ncbi:sensor histidine kinase [Paraglaciecola polaris]|uniref:histidine kinase n=1 Tax=Paraglaciecola polaris LMG 21857 TaxID=1129793 RepID=K6ZUN9_9ALTE|nr:ATP-binding protein [Paraglaciecola polaris]GAC33997.1 two-component system, OmpR family, sensor histidine kinase QseC [Paraglaciecola polaris LMG 21857]|tara:strand:+ start:2725 stop:4059 length:1335 start_codon:yes stop_codon:yes gene_type:complete
MYSIRRQLTLLLIALLILITFSAALQGYRSSMLKSSELFDAELIALANSFGQVALLQQAQTFDAGDQIAVQLWKNTQLFVNSTNTPTHKIGKFAKGYSDKNFSGKRWRVYSQSTSNDDVWVMVGQPLQSRFELADKMIISAMAPIIWTIPLLAVIIYFAVSRGLRPLRSLSDALRHRSPRNFEPLILDQPAVELSPMVTTLNSLLARLQAAFEREQQFASNAAHELRTPLSVLKINLHNLRKEAISDSNTQRIDKLHEDTDRMIHAINQILLLSRTNPEYFEANSSQVDVYQVAQNVISDMYTNIDNKQQTIELIGKPQVILSSEFALLTLLHNLIGNAHKYAPLDGRIQVQVYQDGQDVLIQVDDSGSGLNDDEYAKVLERFYRSSKHIEKKGQGIGLGLAIVKQIVDLHTGRIHLQRSALGGLSVQVFLPRSRKREVSIAQV